MVLEHIPDRWNITNPLLMGLNQESVHFKVCRFKDTPAGNHSVFYLTGFGGTIDAVPQLETEICHRYPLIRVKNYGISNIIWRIPWATFGDVCAILHNSAQAITGIATALQLETYDLVAHSWGGMVSSLNALRDCRCRRAMLLTSTPDICDAVENMYHMRRLQSLAFLGDLVVGKIRLEAIKAKSNRSTYQQACDAISPLLQKGSRNVEMLIYNRAEDRVMRKENVERFINNARKIGILNISDEYIYDAELPQQ